MRIHQVEPFPILAWGAHSLTKRKGVVTVRNLFAMCILSMVVAQPDSMGRKGLMRVDVIERIGSEGPVHSYTPPVSH
jgi:hypothetical protein